MVRMQAAASPAPRCRWLLLAALVVLVPAACTGSKPATHTGTAISPAPVTITWSFWGDPWEREFNSRIARTFELEHAGIQVRLDHRPWGEYFTWLRGEWRTAAHEEAVGWWVTSPISPKAQAILAESGVITPTGRSVRDNNRLCSQPAALLCRCLPA